MRVVVLGGGVSGLTTAVTLAESGHQVEVLSAAFSPHTTSDQAGALWYPTKLEPEMQTREWAIESLHQFYHLANNPETGVALLLGRKYFHRPMGKPWWEKEVMQFRWLNKNDCPTECSAGYEMLLPVLTMPDYLKYLQRRLLIAKGSCTERKIRNWQEFPENSCLVNCTGLGASELCGDAELFPVRGQFLRVEGVSLKHFVLDTDHPEGIIYIVPNSNGVFLGGTAEKGNADPKPDPEVLRAIFKRAVHSIPELAKAKIRFQGAGLRPSRMTLRLESETLGGNRKVIHTYGHGSAGVTLSWGCAKEVLRLCSSMG